MKSHVGLNRLLFWGVSLALLLTAALPACAGIVQLTSDTNYTSQRPAISADGSKVAFDSEADLTTASNSDHSSEIFVINSDGTGLLQLTNSSSALLYTCRASISADGSKIAFQSDQDLTGGNSDNSMEIFVINSDGTGLLQLTSASAPYSCCELAISADGSKVVFDSSADLTTGNPDNSTEIFVINSDGTGLTQVTSSAFASDVCCMPSISADGSKVVFQSNGVLFGSANLDKSTEIFAVNSDGTGLSQLTNQSSASYACCMPKISGDGSKVTFASDADLTAGNSDHSEEIFAINSGGTGLTQLTSDTDISNESDDPCINADGSVVVFESDADLTGANGDFSDEILVVNSDGTGLSQITSASPASIDSQNPSISADGLKVVFDSEADLTGGNSDNVEDIFLATLGDVAVGEPWVQLEYVTPLTPTSVPIPTDYTDPAFSDVDGDFWAWAQIEECAVTATAAEDYIVQGYGDGSYQPTWQVTRGQMAVFVARAAGLTADVSAVSFEDVDEGFWAYTEVERCVDAGIVQGYADYFGPGLDAYLPGTPVDRGQMAVYLYRAVGLSTVAYQGLFSDVADDYWSALEIEACADADISQGYPDGRYLPGVVVTRAQMAVFVWRALVRGDGDVVLGGPAVTDDAAWDPGGDDTAALFLPAAVGTATGANTTDLVAEPGAVVFVVLDAAQVGDGDIVFAVTHEDDADPPATIVDGGDTLAVTAAAGEAAVNATGGVAYLLASYQIDSTLAAEDYTLTITLPNGNVQTMEFTVEP